MEPFRILSVTAQEVKMNRLPVTEEEEWRLGIALGKSKEMALEEIVKKELEMGIHNGVIYAEKTRAAAAGDGADHPEGK